MLKKLRIKNFKSWKDTGEINMAPITMFFGGNSSGKTSLLQFLLMLKQTVEAEDYSGQIFKFNGIVDLGNFKEVVFNHDKKNAIEFWISREGGEKDSFPFGGLIKGFTAKVAEEGGNVVIKNLEIKETKINELKIDQDSSKKDSGKMSFLQRRMDDLRNGTNNFLKGGKESEFFIGRYWRYEYLIPFAYGIEYIGPLRQSPKRNYQWRNNHPTKLGTEGELAVDAIIASNLKKGGLENKVAKALKKMGLIESFKVRSMSKINDEYYKVLVKKTKGSTEVLLPDVGFGVSQILPILTALFYAKSGATLLLEQPEIHLHPKAQLELADIIIDVVKDENIQVIIESHSEHFLTRIQTRIADRTISKDFAKLYFCENESGVSKLEELRLSNSGDIENWPENFFGDMLGESADRVISYLEEKKTKKEKS